jgi:hypothetical protein
MFIRRLAETFRCGTLLWCSAILLASPAAASGSGGQVKVLRITALAGRIYVYADEISNPDGCVTSSYFVVAKEDPGRDQILSLLLTAKSADRKIDMWFEGCVWAPWHASAPLVSAVTLY